MTDQTVKTKAGLEIHPSVTRYDSSKLQTFGQCQRRFFYRYVLGWEPVRSSVHLVHGDAFHRALDILYQGGFTPTPDRIQDAFDEYFRVYRETFSIDWDDINAPKNPDNALQALINYCAYYKNDVTSFDVLYTEVAGRVPVSEHDTVHFRIDLIVKNSEGVSIVEHKTASRMDPNWGDQFAFKIQTGTYSHVGHCLFGDDFYGMRINGIVFTKSAQSSAQKQFIRVPIRKSLDQMDVWLWTVNDYIHRVEVELARLFECSESDSVMRAYPMNAEACFNFGQRCPYYEHCRMWSNPLQHAADVPDDFKISWWDPSDREKTAKKVFDLSAVTT